MTGLVTSMIMSCRSWSAIVYPPSCTSPRAWSTMDGSDPPLVREDARLVPGAGGGGHPIGDVRVAHSRSRGPLPGVRGRGSRGDAALEGTHRGEVGRRVPTLRLPLGCRIGGCGPSGASGVRHGGAPRVAYQSARTNGPAPFGASPDPSKRWRSVLQGKGERVAGWRSPCLPGPSPWSLGPDLSRGCGSD